MTTSGRLGTAQGGPVFSSVQWQCQLLRPQTFRERCFCELLNIFGCFCDVVFKHQSLEITCLIGYEVGIYSVQQQQNAGKYCPRWYRTAIFFFEKTRRIEALKTRQNDPPISPSLNSRIRTLRGSVLECISHLIFVGAFVLFEVEIIAFHFDSLFVFPPFFPVV